MSDILDTNDAPLLLLPASPSSATEYSPSSSSLSPPPLNAPPSLSPHAQLESRDMPVCTSAALATTVNERNDLTHVT